MLTDEEIKRRKPVWFAFSDLWFPGEKGEYEYNNIVKVMLFSKYDLDTMEKICFEEVGSVMRLNLFYDDYYGINEEWLYEKILLNLRKDQSIPLHNIWSKFIIPFFYKPKDVVLHWEKIAEKYKKENS